MYHPIKKLTCPDLKGVCLSLSLLSIFEKVQQFASFYNLVSSISYGKSFTAFVKLHCKNIVKDHTEYC